MATDLVGKRLFFMLLHNARRLKGTIGFTYWDRRGYLLGMLRVMMECQDDFRIADSMRDYWKHQQCGAE